MQQSLPGRFRPRMARWDDVQDVRDQTPTRSVVKLTKHHNRGALRCVTLEATPTDRRRGKTSSPWSRSGPQARPMNLTRCGKRQKMMPVQHCEPGHWALIPLPDARQILGGIGHSTIYNPWLSAARIAGWLHDGGAVAGRPPRPVDWADRVRPELRHGSSMAR